MAKTILQKINDLQYYDGLRGVKEILRNIFSSITSLETNSVIVGAVKTDLTSFPQNSLLVIGKKYLVSLSLGDNFTNIGYIDDNSTFIATGTTPLIWNNNSFVQGLSQDQLVINFNDIDPNVYVDFLPTQEISIKITNGKFLPLKTFTTFTNGYEYIDNNTIKVLNGGAVNAKRPIKIEVYN